MKTTLTPGKWRSLQTTSNDKHTFNIMAFDQRGNYRRMLPAGTPYQAAAQIKREVVSALSPHLSAVLLDPVYGMPAALDTAGTCGLLMCLEKTGYAGVPTARTVDFIDGWTVGKIKQMGASAIKILVYYHPDSETTGDIERCLNDVREACRQADIALFVEPVTYSPDPEVPKESETFAQARPAIIRETARRLSALHPDVLKLEFPVDAAYDDSPGSWAEACAAVSEVCTVPWVLLSAGVDYPVFERQVRVACQRGASGFLGGRAIWKEAVPMTGEERRRFLAETALERVQQLTAIALFARPWTDFYTPIETPEGWFESYASDVPGQGD